MLNEWQLLLNDYTFQIVALGTCLLGVISGLVGSFVVLRKESLLGDTIGHAAFPGIGLGFLIAGERDFITILLGATVTGILATYLINFISKRSPIKLDNAMALVLSFFFGLGTVLMTYIQNLPNANQAGLSNFIFGQASAMLQEDVRVLIVVGLIIGILGLIFWQDFSILTFDPTFYKTVSLKSAWIEFLLSSIIVATIIIGLQSVGVILISALLICPAVASRQWTDRIVPMAFLSGIMGGISGFIGTFLSSWISQVPTGPAIVLVLNVFLAFSLILAPKRGLISRRIRFVRRQKAWKQQIQAGKEN